MQKSTLITDKRFPSGKRVKTTIQCKGGLTEQAQKQSTDINYILRDYQRTGTLQHAKENIGKYDDVTIQDFQEATNLVTETNEMFEGLPSNIRNMCNNDPGQFVEFVMNPANKDKIIELGLAEGNDGLLKDGITPSNAPVADSVPDETPPA